MAVKPIGRYAPGFCFMEINKINKVFLDDSHMLAFSKEFFLFKFSTGENHINYVLTPTHMKGLAQMLTYYVSEFEKLHGKIDREWSPNGIQSPIQLNDLGKPSGSDQQSQNPKKPQNPEQK